MRRGSRGIRLLVCMWSGICRAMGLTFSLTFLYLSTRAGGSSSCSETSVCEDRSDSWSSVSMNGSWSASDGSEGVNGLIQTWVTSGGGAAMMVESILVVVMESVRVFCTHKYHHKKKKNKEKKKKNL